MVPFFLKGNFKMIPGVISEWGPSKKRHLVSFPRAEPENHEPIVGLMFFAIRKTAPKDNPWNTSDSGTMIFMTPKHPQYFLKTTK